MRRLKDELLDTPVQDFGDVQLVFRGASDFVNPAELPGLLAGLAKHSKDFSIERKLVNAAGKRVGAEEHGMRAGRDANRPRRPRSKGARGGCRLVADGGTRVSRRGSSGLSAKRSCG